MEDKTPASIKFANKVTVLCNSLFVLAAVKVSAMHHTTQMTQPMEVNDNETGAVMNMDKAAGGCHTVSQALSAKTVSLALSAKTVNIRRDQSAILHQKYSARHAELHIPTQLHSAKHTWPNTPGHRNSPSAKSVTV